MAVSLRKHDEDFDDQPMSEINVTPLVDVMLVLLIIFMIAAPLMVSGVPVDLPKAQAKQLNDQKPPLAVSVDAGGKYFIGPDEVAPEALLSTLLNHAENELDRRIHVRADRTFPTTRSWRLWGKSMQRASARWRWYPKPLPGWRGAPLRQNLPGMHRPVSQTAGGQK